MPDVSTIIQRLDAFFVERFHITVPSADTDLLETGTLDSLQLVELLFQLEQWFGFRMAIEAIDFDDLRSLSTIAQMVAANSKLIEQPSDDPMLSSQKAPGDSHSAEVSDGAMDCAAEDDGAIPMRPVAAFGQG